MKKTIFSIFVLIFISFLIIGCDIEEKASVKAQKAQSAMAEQAAQIVPIPKVSYFQEKRTIAKWAQRWDTPSIPTYVYLVSFGKILGYYVADGKPASTRSYLMPEEGYQKMAYGDSGNFSNWELTQTPDIDGTYGENNPGIRFFTAEGTAVEWGGDGASYLYSDTPINFGYDIPKLNLK